MSTRTGFDTFVSQISARSPLQKKALDRFLADRDEVFFARAEWVAAGLHALLADEAMDPAYVSEAYLKMCHDMLLEQVRFKKTGEYRCKSAAEAYETVYSSPEEMSSYMYGLGLSQFLWPNHYGMFDFFIRSSRSLQGIRRYLEVGPGHGVYLSKAMGMFPDAAFTAIDISPISLDISRKIVARLAPGVACDFVQADAATHEFQGEFDYIVLCEVVEHLEDPEALLRSLRANLAPGGHLFLTTCSNCPAIDHLYLYDSVEQIRHQLARCGYAIVADLPLAVGDVPEDQWEAQKTEVNYAALLENTAR